MAVTVISKPDAVKLQTASYPLNVTLSSDKVGTVNVDQHKFKLSIKVNTLDIGYKNFIVTTGIQATADMSQILKEYIELPNQLIHNATAKNIPQVNETPLGRGVLTPDPRITVEVVPGETYYESGVFTENVTTAFTFTAYRGETDPTMIPDWLYASHSDRINQAAYPSQPQILWPMSGYGYHAIAVNTGWITTKAPIGGYSYILVGIQVNYGGTNTFNFYGNYLKASPNWLEYVPLFLSTFTNREDYERSIIFFSPSIDGINPIDVPFYAFELIRGFEICDKTISIMYKDRFYQWSFFEFPLKDYYSINKTKESFEDQTKGRQDFNVKGITTQRVNTQIIPAEFNSYVQDMFLSDETYIIGNSIDGLITDLTRVRLSELTWNERTVRNEKIIQYTFNLEHSKDIFVA